MAFTALATGVSGLRAFSQGVGVIADNIANVNTVGYKETRLAFSSLVAEGSTNSNYSPGGVQANTQTLVDNAGTYQISGSATHLAIEGPGFFAVRNAANAVDPNGDILYTRAGDFSTDPQGFYRNRAGLVLLGWPLDTQGNLPTNLNDQDALQAINIRNLNGLADDTNNVALRVNLNAQTTLTPVTPTPVPAPAPAPGDFYDLGDLAAGNITGIDRVFQTDVTVYDSLGRAHTVLYSAVKTDVNTWSYELHFDDPAQLAAAHTDGLIGYGELVFDAQGNADLSSSTLFDIGDNPVDLFTDNLTFDYDTTITGPDAVNVAQGSIKFDFGTGTNGIASGFSQSSNPSSRIGSTADGARFASVSGIEISDSGRVSALFSNGLSREVFQLPVVTFANPNGLGRQQGNAFSASVNSGDPTYLAAGNAGAGLIRPRSLELSTVDLAEQFTDLIRVQRAFSASTKIITTADQLLEELTRLI